MDLTTLAAIGMLIIAVIAAIWKFSHDFSTVKTKTEGLAAVYDKQIGEAKLEIQAMRNEIDNDLSKILGHIEKIQSRFDSHVEGHIRLSDIQDLKVDIAGLKTELKGHRDIVHNLTSTFSALVLRMENQQRNFPRGDK